MPVDPAVRRLLDEWGEADEFDLDAARAGMEGWVAARPGILDDQIAGVPVRRYEPDGASGGLTLIWCHGGGYVLGSALAVDPLVDFFGRRLECTVVSVDYRLAPEHPFPAALDDTLGVLRQLRGDGPVAVGGDSAGGGLVAAACLAARDEGVAVRAQVLLNPFLDATLSFPSINEFARGYGLTRTALREFARLYAGGADPGEPGCSPVLAPTLAGLPPAVIVTAEFDPLRDEGEAYADRLRAAGVPVRARRWDGMVHGFYGMFEVTLAAQEALEWAADALVEMVSDQTDLSA